MQTRLRAQRVVLMGAVQVMQGEVTVAMVVAILIKSYGTTYG